MKKLFCRLLGHNWTVSKWSGSITIPFADEYQCKRCNAIKDMRDV